MVLKQMECRKPHAMWHLLVKQSIPTWSLLYRKQVESASVTDCLPGMCKVRFEALGGMGHVQMVPSSPDNFISPLITWLHGPQNPSGKYNRNSPVIGPK